MTAAEWILRVRRQFEPLRKQGRAARARYPELGAQTIVSEYLSPGRPAGLDPIEQNQFRIRMNLPALGLAITAAGERHHGIGTNHRQCARMNRAKGFLDATSLSIRLIDLGARLGAEVERASCRGRAQRSGVGVWWIPES